MVSEASDSRCRKTLKLLRLRGIKVDFDRFRQARSATDYRPKFRPAAAAAADAATSAYDYVTMSKQPACRAMRGSLGSSSSRISLV